MYDSEIGGSGPPDWIPMAVWGFVHWCVFNLRSELPRGKRPTLTTVTTHERRSGPESAQPCCPGWESVLVFLVRSGLPGTSFCRKVAVTQEL